MIIRDAGESDLSIIIDIYNATVPTRMVTAELEPTTVRAVAVPRPLAGSTPLGSGIRQPRGLAGLQNSPRAPIAARPKSAFTLI